MSPAKHLEHLARVKAVRRRHIATHRDQCVQAIEGIVRPLSWLDRAKAFWQRAAPLAPLLALPLSLFLRRRSRPRGMSGILSWGPLALSLARRVWAMARN